jgi:hypothetical protein
MIINSFLLPGQKSELIYRKLNYTSENLSVFNNDTIKPYYISSNPITNIEYITFLCWVADVYIDYPYEFLKAFPNLERSYIDSLIRNNFQIDHLPLLINSSALTHDYIFNLKYLNYPIMGITWDQAMIFCSWLSDRYNESLLIRKGVLVWNPSPVNEANFNTEAYLDEQYEGIIRQLFYDPAYDNCERKVKWKDRILFPSFRLPSRNELLLVRDQIENSMKAYKYNPFLKRWINTYISTKGNTLTLNFPWHKNISLTFLPADKFQIPINKKITELSLDLSLTDCESDILKIFSRNNQNVVNIDKPIRKDFLGRMPYIVISEDSDLNPIYIQRIDGKHNHENNSNNDLTIFRYSMSAIFK